MCIQLVIYKSIKIYTLLAQLHIVSIANIIVLPRFLNFMAFIASSSNKLTTQIFFLFEFTSFGSAFAPTTPPGYRPVLDVRMHVNVNMRVFVYIRTHVCVCMQNHSYKVAT